MSSKGPGSPEERLVEYLGRVAKQGKLDAEKIDFTQIPEQHRPEIKHLLRRLSQMADETFSDDQNSEKERVNLVKALELKGQCEAALELHRKFGLVEDDERVPEVDQILRVFSLEMLRAAEKLSDPRLILCTKGVSVYRLASAINAHEKERGKEKVQISQDTKIDWSGAPQSWQAYIVEGFEKRTGRMAYKGDVRQSEPYTPAEIRKKSAFQVRSLRRGMTSDSDRKSVSGMTGLQFLYLLMATVIEQENARTPSYYDTFLLGEAPKKSGRMPCGRFSGNNKTRISLSFLDEDRHYWGNIYVTRPGYKLRYAIGGNVPD